jgi:hypothetical protein
MRDDNSPVKSDETIESLLEMIRVPSKVISLAGFTTGVYTVPNGGICNCAEQKPSGTDGAYLNVHPIGNPDDRSHDYLMPLGLGGVGRNTCRFDKVIFAGSTVTMSDIVIFQE